jgi:hypothetical protein
MKIWPWSTIRSLENQLKREKDMVDHLKVQYYESEDRHRSTKAELDKVKADHETLSAHMRKATSIIALKGGIVGLLLFLSMSVFGQGIQRQLFTTNPPPLLSQTAGPMVTTNGAGLPQHSYNGAALTNLPTPLIWTTNAGTSGGVGLAGFPKHDSLCYLSPTNGNRGTNIWKMNIASVDNNPANADGFTLNYDYAGVGNVPAALVVNFGQANGLLCQEGQTYGAFYNNNATNFDTVGWLYVQDASVGSQGQAVSQANNSGAGVGVQGWANGRGLAQAGTVGTVQPVNNGQTNIGVAAVTVRNSKSGVFTGIYAEVVDDTTVDPSLENSVALLDNRATGLPLLTARANGVRAFQVTATGVILGNAAGLTNYDYIMPTNIGGGNVLISGSPTVASTYYFTNITANTTLAAMTFWNNGASSINLHCTVSGGTDRVLTFPNGVNSVQWGSPAAVTVTNGSGADFQVLCVYGKWTNLVWVPTVN